MRSLLQKADTSARQADAQLEFRRPDLAFVEYLTAFTILVNVMPRHKDFPELNKRRGELWQLNLGLKAVGPIHRKHVDAVLLTGTDLADRCTACEVR